MKYLKTPAELAAAIGATVNGGAPATGDTKFIALLDACMSKIENILDTPLERRTYTDTFDVDGRFLRKNEVLRLTAGFVDPATVVVTDPRGVVVNSLNFFVGQEKGTVDIDRPIAGRYKVTYTAGFTAIGAPSVYQDTPSALKSLMDPAAVIWVRAISLTGKIQEGVSFSQLLAPVYREMAGAAYGRFQRPRARVVYPRHSESVEVV